MIPPLRRGHFVRLVWKTDHGTDQIATGMIGLASQDGRSVAVLGEFIVAGFVGMVPLSEVGPGDLATVGTFETLTGVPVRLERFRPDQDFEMGPFYESRH